MDQLRKAGDWLRRHHFWVLTVIAILVALGGWWKGGNALWANYQSNKSKIESEFNNANTVASKAFHANSAVQEAQAAEIAKQQESVNALWKVLYDRQTAAVLKWPANLSEEFRDYIAKLNFGAEIPRNLRAHYNNYIRDHFPELPKIVGALETADTGQGGGGYGARGGGGSVDVQSILQNMHNSTGRGGTEDPGQAFEEPEFLVIWADQQLIRDELAPRSTPSSKRIWKTQEDLWVYEALLTIIANTNKAAGADQFSNSAIRVIESLEVGRTAAQASRGKGRIEMPVAAPTGDPMMEGGGEMMDGGRGGMSPEMMDGGGMGMEGMYGGGRGEMGMGTDSATMDAELFNNRYVGEDGAPMADPGGSDMSAFGTEFKRLPVRMRLWMDQRWVPQLISECANAPLQVEVQEVRVNPADDGASGGGYGGGGGRGEMGGYGGATTAMTMDMTPEQEPNMKTVVLQGTVYIFNPPTTDALPASDPALSTASAE